MPESPRFAVPTATGEPGRGAVAAGSPVTAAAAAAVLAAGGSAVDAVLAGGFAAPVAEPGLSSLGGGGFLTVRRPDGEIAVLDFFPDTPGRGLPEVPAPHFVPVTVRFAGAEQVFHVGAGSVAVPGVLDGYLHAHQAWGRLPLADVVAPAVAAAEDGVIVDAAQAHVMTLIADILTLTDAARALYAPTGMVPGPGQRHTNPDYAEFLRRCVRDGARARAAFATAAVEAVQAGGGILTAQDLRAYRPVLRSPLTLARDGSVLSTNPAPSFGGGIVVGALAVLDPDVVRAAGGHAAQAAVLRQVTDAHRRAAASAVRGTTHISVVDAEGTVAAMTTSNGSCSGVVVPGFGIQLNNMLGESDLHPSGFHSAAPGTRIASMMAPSILVGADGTVTAFGSGGSERIRSALLGVVLELTDRGRPLADAIAAPRVHPAPDAVDVEPGLPADAIAAFDADGVGALRVWPQPDLYFGGVHAVRRSPDGAVVAVADPRRGGAVALA